MKILQKYQNTDGTVLEPPDSEVVAFFKVRNFPFF